MSKIEKKSWISKVLAQLNMDSDGHVGLFYDLATKSFAKAIKGKEKEITKLEEDKADYLERQNEILAELQAELAETAITVDKDALVTREARESYFETYVRNVIASRRKVADQERAIKEFTESVDGKIKRLNEQIDEQKSLLSFLAD